MTSFGLCMVGLEKNHGQLISSLNSGTVKFGFIFRLYMSLPVVFNTFCKILKICDFAGFFLFGEYLDSNEISSMVRVERRMFCSLLLRNATAIAT